MKKQLYLVQYRLPHDKLYFIRHCDDFDIALDGSADCFTENEVLRIIARVEDVQNLKIINIIT